MPIYAFCVPNYRTFVRLWEIFQEIPLQKIQFFHFYDNFHAKNRKITSQTGNKMAKSRNDNNNCQLKKIKHEKYWQTPMLNDDDWTVENRSHIECIWAMYVFEALQTERESSSVAFLIFYSMKRHEPSYVIIYIVCRFYIIFFRILLYFSLFPLCTCLTTRTCMKTYGKWGF